MGGRRRPASAAAPGCGLGRAAAVVAGGGARLVAPDPEPLRLPVLLKLDEGRAPVLTMIRPAGSAARLVFRVWPSGIVLCDGEGTPHPLMLASVVGDLRPG